MQDRGMMFRNLLKVKILNTIQTGCGDCESIIWKTPSKGTRIDPPANTVAVVVDVVDNRGAIRIFEKEGEEYVDGVGTEETGNLVIVPWESSWWFRVSGSIRTGYVVVKDATQVKGLLTSRVGDV